MIAMTMAAMNIPRFTSAGRYRYNWSMGTVKCHVQYITVPTILAT